MVQALVISRITYGTPYLGLKIAEITKLDILFSYFNSSNLQISIGTASQDLTEKLFQLGIHNTWQELTEAHKASQMERLKLTPTGRATLYRLGYEPSVGPQNQK